MQDVNSVLKEEWDIVRWETMNEQTVTCNRKKRHPSAVRRKTVGKREVKEDDE